VTFYLQPVICDTHHVITSLDLVFCNFLYCFTGQCFILKSVHILGQLNITVSEADICHRYAISYFVQDIKFFAS
jgi:hypothetical protein